MSFLPRCPLLRLSRRACSTPSYPEFRILPSGLVDDRGKPPQRPDRYFLMIERNLQSADPKESVSRTLLNMSQAGASFPLYEKVVDVLASRGIQLDIKTVGRVVQHICKQGQVGVALQWIRLVEEKLQCQPDPPMFHTLIRQAINSKDPMRVVGLIREMRHRQMTIPSNFLQYATNYVEQNPSVSLDPEHYKNAPTDKSGDNTARIFQEAVDRKDLSEATKAAGKLITQGKNLPVNATNNYLVYLCEEKAVKVALEIAKRLPKTNYQAREKLLQTVVAMKDWERAMELVRHLQKQKTRFPGLHSLFNQLCKVNLIDHATEVREVMKEADQKMEIHSYTIYLNALVRAFQFERAESVFHEMQESGIQPDVVVYGSLLKGFCEAGHLSKATTLFQSMSTEGVTPNVNIYNILMRGHCNAGDLSTAVSLFDQMSQSNVSPDVFSYSVIINGYCKAGQLQEALQWFEKLKQSGQEPNVIVYNTLIKAHFDGADRGSALSLYNAMQERGIEPSSVTYNILLNGFRSESSLTEAMQIFSEMEKHQLVPNPATAATLIADLSTNGDTEQAHNVLLRLKKMGITIDQAMYTDVIMGHLKQGELPEIIQLLTMMNHEHISFSEKIVSALRQHCEQAEGNMEGLIAELAELGIVWK